MANFYSNKCSNFTPLKTTPLKKYAIQARGLYISISRALGLFHLQAKKFQKTIGFKIFFFISGEAPDGTRYKTDYRCEGDRMKVSCDSGETIQVVRANYGRFSIAICNDDGKTHWSVNCMSPKTRHILQNK